MWGRRGGGTDLFVMLDSRVEEEGNDKRCVFREPVMGEFFWCQGRVTLEETLVHGFDIHFSYFIIRKYIKEKED